MLGSIKLVKKKVQVTNAFTRKSLNSKNFTSEIKKIYYVFSPVQKHPMNVLVQKPKNGVTEISKNIFSNFQIKIRHLEKKIKIIIFSGYQQFV